MQVGICYSLCRSKSSTELMLSVSKRDVKQSFSIFIFIHRIFRRPREDNSGVGGGIWPKLELIQAFMHVLVTYKNEGDSYKNEGARVVT